MATYSLLRSAISPVHAGSRAEASPADRFKVSSVSFNCNSVKFQSNIFGASVPGDSSSLQKSSFRSIQPIQATATELPPTIQKSKSGGKMKIGINDFHGVIMELNLLLNLLVFSQQLRRLLNTRSYNATLMLETLRGKRMMFVGDSLNRGQYVSMICLLHSIIPEHAKSMETNGSLTIFTAKDYNATIEFYWAPFLLESNSDDAIIHRVSDRVVRKGSINKHGRNWKGVDIMVFNTYLWWMTGLKFKILQGSFDDEVQDIAEVSTEDAYRMGMKSMLRWVKKNMDPKKTRVFFTSMSPSHAKSIDWGGDQNGNCYNETSMIKDPTYWGSDTRKSIMQVIGQVFSKTKVPITFLNITQLSSYRKDAHTSIYKEQWSPLTPEQLANPVSYADCVHWCLPGLQDTWNELLFSKLFYP